MWKNRRTSNQKRVISLRAGCIKKMLREQLFEHPRCLFFIAVLLMLFGVVMPFLMVIHVVQSTFFLNFLSYGASTLGLLLGLVSLAASRIKQKQEEDQENRYR